MDKIKYTLYMYDCIIAICITVNKYGTVEQQFDWSTIIISMFILQSGMFQYDKAKYDKLG